MRCEVTSSLAQNPFLQLGCATLLRFCMEVAVVSEADSGQQKPKPKVEAPPSAPVNQKKMTAEDFITKAPLFVVENVDGFYPPDQISFECDGDCAKETTWNQVYQPSELNKETPDSSVQSVAYRCFLCKKQYLTVIYKEMQREKRYQQHGVGSGLSKQPVPPPSVYNVVVGVMKVGQYPPPVVSLPTALSKNLGPDAAALYRKGLQCRNYGFGLAAVGYFRRVVEDKTNELIEVAAKLAESHNVDVGTIAKMRAATNLTQYTPYEDKLRIAATVFPDSLKVDGMNPLKLLFGLVSKGLHSLSEAECIEIADETTDVFDFIFTNLRAQVDDRKAFATKVKKLSLGS